ncbi:MAG: hypothetical protein AAF357_10080 [Verrucomicrobiota bacterium]
MKKLVIGFSIFAAILYGGAFFEMWKLPLSPDMPTIGQFIKDPGSNEEPNEEGKDFSAPLR